MSGKVSDLLIRYKRAVFTQKKLDRKNFRSGNGGRVLRNPPGVKRCWSRAWSHDSLSHGIDKMADPVMLSIFGFQLLMFVQVVVTFMHVRQRIILYDTWQEAHIRSRLVFRDSMRRLREAAERDLRARLRRQTITATQLQAYRRHRKTMARMYDIVTNGALLNEVRWKQYV